MVVAEKIEHFSHSGTEPVSVDGFYFSCRKIGGEVCDESFFFEQVIACEEGFQSFPCLTLNSPQTLQEYLPKSL